MPWQVDGNYYSFKDESIKARAPAVSGVYGLYNVKRQIFIGETADIRGALLHHEKTAGSRLRFYRPTGFTFEVCAAEVRANRAQELIVEYRPALQTRAAFLFGPWALWRRRRVNPFEPCAAAGKNRADHNDRLVPIIEEPEDAGRGFHFRRDQIAIVALAFAMTAAIIVVLRTLNAEAIFVNKTIGDHESAAQPAAERADQSRGSAAPPQPVLGSWSYLGDRTRSQAIEKAPSNQLSPGGNSLEHEGSESKAAGNDTATPLAKLSARGSDTTAQQPAGSNRRHILQAPKPYQPEKKWTVQVNSSTDKAFAEEWKQRLTNKGYDAFVVETAVKDRTWYRVRVGHFENFQEADTLRKTLAFGEGVSGAFVAR